MDRDHRTSVTATNAPRPTGTYSHAIVAGGFLFTAGQGPLDPVTGSIVGGDITEQTTATLTNIDAILQAAGASLEDVIKTTVHLANLDDFAKFDEAYRNFFTDPAPARTTVQSGLPGIAVEIDVIAKLPEAS